MKTFPQIYTKACRDLAQNIEQGQVMGTGSVIDKEGNPNCALGWLSVMSGIEPDVEGAGAYFIFEDVTGIDDRNLSKFNDVAFEKGDPDIWEEGSIRPFSGEQRSLAKKQLIDMLRHAADRCESDG